jgi:hypothetical protein
LVATLYELNFLGTSELLNVLTRAATGDNAGVEVEEDKGVLFDHTLDFLLIPGVRKQPKATRWGKFQILIFNW